jgi:hypothetical protein
MQIKRDELVGLFTALGYNTASKWSSNRLLEKVKKIDFENAEVGPENTALLESIKTAIQNKESLTLPAVKEEDQDPAKEVKKQVKEPVKKKLSKDELAERKMMRKEVEEDQAAEEAGEDETEEDKAEEKKPQPKKAEAKKKGPGKNPGIIKTIVEVLSNEKPVSREQILARLVKRFPDRSEKSMTSTVQTQVPCRLRKNGFEIEETDGKYRCTKSPE